MLVYRPQKNESNMDPVSNAPENDELRPEYDFSGGIRGKHYEAYRQGTNVVFLDAHVAQVFKNSASVNEALRLLLKLAKEQVTIE